MTNQLILAMLPDEQGSAVILNKRIIYHEDTDKAASNIYFGAQHIATAVARR